MKRMMNILCFPCSSKRETQRQRIDLYLESQEGLVPPGCLWVPWALGFLAALQVLSDPWDPKFLVCLVFPRFRVHPSLLADPSVPALIKSHKRGHHGRKILPCGESIQAVWSNGHEYSLLSATPDGWTDWRTQATATSTKMSRGNVCERVVAGAARASAILGHLTR